MLNLRPELRLKLRSEYRSLPIEKTTNSSNFSLALQLYHRNSIGDIATLIIDTLTAAPAVRRLGVVFGSAAMCAVSGEPVPRDSKSSVAACLGMVADSAEDTAALAATDG